MGFGKKFLGVLALTGAAVLAADMGQSWSDYQRGQRAIIEEPLEISRYSPNEGFIEHYLDERFGNGPNGVIPTERYQELEERVSNVKESNPEFIAILERNIFERYRAKATVEAAIKTLGRLRAKDSIYRIAVSKSLNAHDLKAQALRELDRIDRKTAFRAAMEVVKNWEKQKKFPNIDRYGIGNRVQDVLIDMGTPDALNYFIRVSDPDSLVLFVLKNKDKDFVYARKEKILDIMETALTYNGEINCSLGRYTLTTYGRAIHQLDTDYANALSYEAIKDCDQALADRLLRGENGLRPFMDALRGQY